jgi:uncharacterized protein (DUF58 family)
VTRRVSPRLRILGAISGAALIAALLSGRSEFVALAAPALTLVTVGLLVGREPVLSAAVALGTQRVLENDSVPVTISLVNGSPRPVEVEVELAVTGAGGVVSGGAGSSARLRAGESRELSCAVVLSRWGVHPLGEGEVRVRHPLGLMTWVERLQPAGSVRVYPRAERLRELIAPLRTQMMSGNRVSRQRGEGIEFADIRSFQLGDRARRVNWRASARRGELYVNEQHPERNADVILFIDSFEEARSPSGGTLDMALRAAATLAAAYLERRDRVGIVTFGGVLRWLEPSLGPRALYRLVDALLHTNVVFSYAWKTVDVIPRRLLPAGSLVVALTPLLDERSIRALFDLRRRGYDLTIVECDAEPFLPEPRSDVDRAARSLWALQRNGIRRRLRQMGVTIVRWQPGAPLALPIQEVITSRRHAPQRQLA